VSQVIEPSDRPSSTWSDNEIGRLNGTAQSRPRSSRELRGSPHHRRAGLTGFKGVQLHTIGLDNLLRASGGFSHGFS
jgi:hypothetical protein